MLSFSFKLTLHFGEELFDVVAHKLKTTCDSINAMNPYKGSYHEFGQHVCAFLTPSMNHFILQCTST